MSDRDKPEANLEPETLEPLPGAEEKAPRGESPAETNEAQEAVNEVAQLRKDLADLNDAYLRALADLENYRRHVQAERARLLEYANEQLLRELLTVVDDLERAIQHAPSEDPLRRGVELILSKLLSIMANFGAEPFSAIGEQFDPYRHEAVECLPTSDHPENTVVREHQRGWMYREKLLRPARVVVATRPSNE
ncbi:MAG: nucleotide exchange factor GrpE [Armatimonadetes bacterium]|nr:nucleotide exchange factor GrpE [Armatimonadota bacterium]